MGVRAVVRICHKFSFKFLAADPGRKISDVICTVYMIKKKIFVKVKHFYSLY